MSDQDGKENAIRNKTTKAKTKPFRVRNACKLLLRGRNTHTHTLAHCKALTTLAFNS